MTHVRMAYFALLDRTATGYSMRAELAGQVINHDKLVLLFINYVFFSVIIMTFTLCLVCITQTASFTLDIHSMMTLLAVCFIMINMVVADYLVATMSINKDLRLAF